MKVIYLNDQRRKIMPHLMLMMSYKEKKSMSIERITKMMYRQVRRRQ